jgi:glutamate--cysteine ligase
MDLDPFVPVGITAATMRFLDVFLLHCLLAESPPDTPDEIGAIRRNQRRVAALGREPGLKLGRGAQEVSLFEWGGQIAAECGPLAEMLDAAHGGGAYRAALAAAIAALKDPTTVPSARVLTAMSREHGGSHLRIVLALSKRHADTLRGLPLAAEVEAHFARLAAESLEEQRRIEAADAVPFETFRQRYLAPERLEV